MPTQYMLNVGRINLLANVVETLPDGNEQGHFTMYYFSHHCGTAACLAGWTQVLFAESNDPKTPLLERQINHGITSIDCGEMLGLTPLQTSQLFMPRNGYALYSAKPGSPRHVTAKRAAAVLRNLARTGEVDWSTGYERKEGNGQDVSNAGAA